MTTYPVAVQRGTKALINFAGPAVEGCLPVEVEAPRDPAVTSLQVVPRTASGQGGWPVHVPLSEFEQVVEVEPNNEPGKANRIPVPGGMSARFLEKNDRDFFRFAVKKGVRYTILVQTYEIGSAAEVFLVLKDEKGVELGRSNPQESAARINFTAQADGDVILAAEHLLYAHGPNEIYYLTVVPTEPDFDVILGLDRFDLPAGSTALVPVMAVNRREYAGPVELSITGHPGLSGKLILQPGSLFPALLPVTSKADLPPGGFAFSVLARGNANGKEIIHVASVADLAKQNLNGLGFPPAEVLTSLVAGVADRPLFALGGKCPDVLRGRTTNVMITAKRREGFAEEIALASIGLPPGVAVAVKPIAKNATEVQFPLTIGPEMPLGVYTITFRGTSKWKGKDFAYYASASELRVVMPLEVKLEPVLLEAWAG